MTVPPPIPHEPGKRVAVPVEDPESVALPIEAETVFECPCMDWLGGDERDSLVRRTVLRLNPWLHFGPQPLPLVLDLLECDFDMDPGCAERLFWLAQERGYLSLHEGNVYLGRLRAEV
jgi:hypothetical protein